MRVISFNANGIRSAARKGFFEWLSTADADFVCIQETKAQFHQLEADSTFCPAPYYCEYADAEKKGYSGVAIYAREKPEQIIKSFGFERSDIEGRYIQFDYKELSIISIYLPSGTSGDVRQQFKYEYLDVFSEHLKALNASGRKYIICGDYNIAHHNIDIKNWRSNQKNSGFLPEERAWLDVLFGSMGYVDAFREVNSESEQYTWWSNRGQARAKNVGWRIDYQVISENLKSCVRDAKIVPEPLFSDHAPLIIDYELNCQEVCRA